MLQKQSRVKVEDMFDISQFELKTFVLLRTINSGICLIVPEKKMSKKALQMQYFGVYSNVDFISYYADKIPKSICGNFQYPVDVYDVLQTLDLNEPDQKYFRFKLEWCILTILGLQRNRPHFSGNGVMLKCKKISVVDEPICQCSCHVPCSCDCHESN